MIVADAMRARFVRPSLVVVGGAPEIDAESETWSMLRLPLDAAPPSLPLGAVLVFDLRAAPLEDLVRVREVEPFASVPLLLVSDLAIPERVIALLRADDSVDVTAGRDTLHRRLALTCELARLRLITSFAEQALEQSVNGLSIVDMNADDAPLVYVSSVLERLTGYPAAEMLGRNCRFLQGEDRDEAVRQEVRAALAERRRASVLVRNARKDGSPFWNELTVFPLVAGGRATHWMAGVQHDVTEIVGARAAIDLLGKRLIDRQRFDHAVLDGVDAGIIITDEAGSVTFLNRTAANLLRVTSELTGTAVQDVLGLADGPTRLLSGQSRRFIAHPMTASDGTELDLELSVSRGEADVDQRVGFFFIFRDVRDEKQRKAEQSRFERLVAMGTMVAGFAHEVRNPVAALRSIAEELAEELRDAGVWMPHVGLMLKMVERIERLVTTSLQFGRPAAPRRSPQRPWVILSSAISELHPRLRGLAKELVIEVEPELPDVDVDEKQIAQALVILLNNALDATGDPSRVVARIRSGRAADDLRARAGDIPSGAGAVRFEIVDDGAGIPPDIVDRIFDPFFSTKATGTGLGLSIAQQIVSENGAHLEVASVPGGLTSFSIVIGET